MIVRKLLAQRRQEADLTIPAKEIQKALAAILPYTNVQTNRDGSVFVSAGDTIRSNNSIDTTPGGSKNTGIGVTIFLEDGKIAAKVEEINSAQRKQGMGRAMLQAVASAGIPVYHGTDMSNGFWRHIKKEHPELLNRPKLRDQRGTAKFEAHEVPGGWQIWALETGEPSTIDQHIYKNNAEAAEVADSYNYGYNKAKGLCF
jgi:hypothetical protein